MLGERAREFPNSNFLTTKAHMATSTTNRSSSADAEGVFLPPKRSQANPAKMLSSLAAGLPLLALVGILVVLADQAWPAIKFNGLGFFHRSAWHPGNFYLNPVRTEGVLHPAQASYGAWPLIVGTVESSLIAIVIALPLSIASALIVAKHLGPRLRSFLGIFFELLAGIPSVVFGLWGTVTLGPIFSRDIYPILAKHAPNVFLLRFFRGSTGAGEGLLTSGLILAIMIIPIIASTTRDLFSQVPKLTEEGAAALGMTDWEITRSVTIPWTSAGIVGATVLGLARALGETMAVAMVSGSVLGTLPTNVYATFTTIAATIVSQLDSALTDATGLAVRTLAEAALVLMVVTLFTNIGARILVKRVSPTALPVGRGI